MAQQNFWRLIPKMHSLKIGRSGKTFIIEHSGDLVATSTVEQPFILSYDGEKKTYKRLKAIARLTTQYLQSRLGNFKNIYSGQQLEFEIDATGVPYINENRYNCTEIRLSLENSQPFAGTITPTGQIPKWQIDFQPNTEEITTWNEVFHIRERYERNELDPKFKSWMDDFKRWCKSAKIVPSSDQELVEAINRYATYYEEMGISDRAFLKAALFRMLHTYCQQGDQRLIFFIMSNLT